MSGDLPNGEILTASEVTHLEQLASLQWRDIESGLLAPILNRILELSLAVKT